MSEFYKNNSNESTKDLYQKSLIYKSDASNIDYANLKDFSFAEKYLYGRVNRAYVPIEIDTSRSIFKGLPETNKGDANGFQAMNFVADAFADVVMQFRKKIAVGQIRTDDMFLSQINVFRAYESPRTLFGELHFGNKQTIEQIFKQGNIKFENFEEFMMHMSEVLPDLLELTPFTYPAFVKSKLCPMVTTGLVIDIANESSSNDEEKINKFINSPNWEYFLNVCRSYGFSVDLNVPWRLVADIGTPEMIQYARNYGYLSTDAVLTQAYIPAHVTYYENFKNIMFDLYSFVKRDYIEVEYCQDGTTRTKVITPKDYSTDARSEAYSDMQFLEFYMNLRIAEEKEISLDKHEIKELIRQCKQLARTETQMTIVSRFENAIAATYDNSGSLTDQLYRVKVQEDEEINVLSNT